ncbi:hypothetical protein CR513_47522, partial [Mucuna pruriens]
MKAFPFSLDGAAKDWLYLQPVLLNTWGDMKRMFLEKFFLASRITTIRKEICGIRQHSRETLHEYWERFNNEQLLIQFFYKGLMMIDRRMIDAGSGGALMDKTPAVARNLISNIASSIQQFWIKGASPSWMVNEIGGVDNLRLENQLTEFTLLVRKLAIGQHQPSIVAIVYEWLSVTNSAIPSATVPTTVTTKSATSRKLTISRRLDEVAGHKQSGVPIKHEVQ